MMRMIKRIILSAIFVFSSFLCACSAYSQGGFEFDPGQTLSPEMLESIFISGTPEPEVSETEETTAMTVDENTVVYFTEGGTKYHLFADCGSLARSENVQSCKLAENEKEECCKHCQKRAGLLPAEE